MIRMTTPAMLRLAMATVGSMPRRSRKYPTAMMMQMATALTTGSIGLREAKASTSGSR